MEGTRNSEQKSKGKGDSSQQSVRGLSTGSPEPTREKSDSESPEGKRYNQDNCARTDHRTYTSLNV